MDAYYASIEQVDDPKLKGRPVAVGSGDERGVVAAASYEARKFGVKSAMSSALAKKKCKHIIFVKPRFTRYKEISIQIRNIFSQFTDLVEPISLDEAFLDVTENKFNIGLATNIARIIRKKIFNELKLTSSAGISINKFLAKVATEINKPNGQKTIHPKIVDQFINNLPIEKFYGIGKVTSQKMNKIGIYTGADLRKKDCNTLMNHFGKQGSNFYKIVRSIQNNPVNPNRVRKSIGAEKTFKQDIQSEDFILNKLSQIAEEIERRMMTKNDKGKTVTVKLKFNDFSQNTRSKTISNYINKKSELIPIIQELIFEKPICKPVRLLGISVSNLESVKSESLNDHKFQLKIKFK